MTKRKLPHWQIGGSWYFVTFRAKNPLSPKARTIVAECVIYNHKKKYDLGVAVVMPDHVHILLHPIEKDDKSYFTLTEIMRAIKGIAGRKINFLDKRTGSIWQKESFDRIVRNENEWSEKYQYIRNNAIKAGLADTAEGYEWLLERDDFNKRF
ncbi:MAG: transposase [Nitrospinae bacterium]|nr:transposase [Nitrospinota bacterium]